MNTRVLHTLEYDKIKATLLGLCGSEGGRRLAGGLQPISDIDIINKLQDETAAALARLERRGNISFEGIPDINDVVMRINISSTLSMGELRKVASVLTMTAKTKQYGDTKGDIEIQGVNEAVHTDCLCEFFDTLCPMPDILREINRCIISDCEMADDASHALNSIRKQIKAKQAKISEKMAAILKETADDERLSDNLITMRNGRYCIPVKSEYKNKIPGMIHDQSQSKSTFFIEPMEVVALNNEIRELEIEEKEEIERILTMLTLALKPDAELLKSNVDILIYLDAVFARGRLARSMRAVKPEFSDNYEVDIKRARHPLINPANVVPVDISLGREFNMLLITGPNTGGKTVSLKTIGLFQLMGQSGLHIPALGGSVLGVFDEIYADIGDEQSIEQSLSTFSSHMTNTVNIIKEANSSSLVLFDELGAGTDPAQGAALAMAILNDLNTRNIRTMATTHYSELKAYALTTPGVTNGSCEFDEATLRPTYRLLIGVPGKSNAFAISRRIGIPEEILQAAEGLIDEESRSFDDYLTELDSLIKEAKTLKDEAAAEKKEADRLLKETSYERERLREKKDKELNKAKEEAREILEEAKNYADQTIRRINRLSSNQGNMRELEEERRALRKKVTEGSVEIQKEQIKVNNKTSDFKIGMSVHCISMDLDGTVHSLPNKKGECTITMGIMQYKCHISDLIIRKDDVKLPEKVKRTGEGALRVSKSFSISQEINLVGKYPDEAVALLEKYIDDAYLAGIPQVRVIHGRGTGALRKAVHDYLKRCRVVKHFRLGEFGEGDQGVTIVEFK